MNLNDVTFVENSATNGLLAYGGGLYAQAQNVTLTDVHFSNNTVYGDSYGRGGGLWVRADDTVGTLTNVTFLENTASGGSSANGGAIYVGSGSTISVRHGSCLGSRPEGIYVESSSTLDLTNSVMWDNDQDLDGSGTLILNYNCTEQDLSLLDAGTGNIDAGTDPFDQAASGELFLKPGSVCIDKGDSGVADIAYDGGVWQDMTTHISGTPLDTPPADPGAHYDPLDPWILDFTADGTNVTWTTYAPTGGTCAITADGFSYSVPSGNRASGATAHGIADPDAGLTMTCTGASGHKSVAITSTP
jgi:predicted outer membrane repeat protein